MQTITVPEKLITNSIAENFKDVYTPHAAMPSPMVWGMHKKIIKVGIWLNIIAVALYVFKNPVKAFKATAKLSGLRDNLRDNHPIIKYARVNGKYYYTFNAPGWPSKAFNKFIANNLQKLEGSNAHHTLDTILFGITKKCGYQCEHCFEWEALNKPETLSRENLLSVIHLFQHAGIAQVQLSGGEPLNRFDDIIYILKKIKPGTEVWLYTSGYHFTEERAALLKQHCLTGITVSLDHWIPELHDAFRGKKNAFEWAQKAVAHAKAQGLVVCLSLCATKGFISVTNLGQYAELAKSWGVSFIQLLEPRAVGHYADKDVYLNKEQISLLENFYTEYNFNAAYNEYPSIVYHGFYSRRLGCGGAGNHYVYIDTDGDVHNCPFCQRKLFSALHGSVQENLRLMAQGSCSVYTNSSPKI